MKTINMGPMKQIGIFEEKLKDELLQFAFMFVGYHIFRYLFNSEFGLEQFSNHAIIMFCIAWILTGAFIQYYRSTVN